MIHYYLNENGIEYLDDNIHKNNTVVNFLRHIVRMMGDRGYFAPSMSDLLTMGGDSANDMAWKKIQDMGLVTMEGEESKFREIETGGSVENPRIAIDNVEMPVRDYLWKVR